MFIFCDNITHSPACCHCTVQEMRYYVTVGPVLTAYYRLFSRKLWKKHKTFWIRLQKYSL